MKLIEKSIALALILTVLFSFTGFAGQCEDIPDHVLRLHVLANSDSDEDQTLKLKVRDRILDETSELFAAAESKEESIALAQSHLEQIKMAAEDEIQKQGYHYEVSVKLEEMYFTTRQYDNVSLPAGMYDALRVEIGSGEGKNWWCVMFPPMCLPAAEEEQELEDVLSDSKMELVTESSYEVKWKVVEWYEQIRGWLAELL